MKDSNMISSNNFSKILRVLVIFWSIVFVVSAEEDEYIDSYQAEEVIGLSPVELIKLRGFRAENHYAPTKDGYFINVVRIINPRITSKTLKRPVIFNHGLLESATIWLINSHGIVPQSHGLDCSLSFDHNGTEYVNGPFMLSNFGYDVWLMSMRGTDWSLEHRTLSYKQLEFWNYCLDDFGLVDIPSVVNYVRQKTKSQKVAYIGHSQATFSIFALLSTRPSYADVIEPVIAIAPVSFLDHITSISRILFLATLTATDRDKHGPFPGNAKKIRNLVTKFCTDSGKKLEHKVCEVIEILISGPGKRWLNGYYSHLPFHTSLKVLRHFGQLIKHKRFLMYDYGEETNKRLYGTYESPSYPIELIRSHSLCLISTKSDALSRPEDVQKFKDRLTVPLFKNIYIDKDFNHFDLITDRDARDYVFRPILEIFEHFELHSGICQGQGEESETGVEYETESDGESDEQNSINDGEEYSEGF